MVTAAWAASVYNMDEAAASFAEQGSQPWAVWKPKNVNSTEAETAHDQVGN